MSNTVLYTWLFTKIYRKEKKSYLILINFPSRKGNKQVLKQL